MGEAVNRAWTRARVPMSVVVGAASLTSAAIAADSSYFKLVGGRPVVTSGPPKVFRAGAHAGGVAGVSDFAGSNFIGALADAMASVRAVAALPETFIARAGAALPEAYVAWSAASIVPDGHPERFFEAVLAWHEKGKVELWRLHTTRDRNELRVNIEPHPARDQTSTVLVAGSRDNTLDRHDISRRHERTLEIYARRQPVQVPLWTALAADLETHVTSLVIGQLRRGVQPPAATGWPGGLSPISGPVQVVTLGP